MEKLGSWAFFLLAFSSGVSWPEQLQAESLVPQILLVRQMCVCTYLYDLTGHCGSVRRLTTSMSRYIHSLILSMNTLRTWSHVLFGPPYLPIRNPTITPNSCHRPARPRQSLHQQDASPPPNSPPSHPDHHQPQARHRSSRG